MIHAATAHASRAKEALTDRSPSERTRLGSEDLGPLEDLEDFEVPPANLQLKLKTALEHRLSEMPDSPHKISPKHGDEFDIFLRFKERTRIAKCSRFSTMIDVQRLFLNAFNFPEKSLHVFLLNKVRLEILERIPGAPKKSQRVLFTVLSQLHPGVVVEAFSDVWESWFKYAEGGGRLMKRLSINPRLLNQSTSMTRKLDKFMNDPEANSASFYFSVFVNLLIFLSSLTFVVETLPFVHNDNRVRRILDVIEAVCVSSFTFELGGRFIVAESQSKFVRNTMNMIDFIAILPFYLQLFAKNTPIPGLSILRLLRLARVLRLFKVMKTFMSVLSGTVASSSTPLVMLTFFLSITIVIYSSVLYYAERGTYDEALGIWKRRVGYMCPYVCLQEDPYLGCDFKGQVVDVFSNWRVGKFKDDCQKIYQQSPFDSIISTFWTVTQTMTVVGYGSPDSIILSELGKFVGTCTVLTGILCLALPISIIETNFTSEIAIFRKKTIFMQIQKKIKKELNTEGTIHIPN